MEGMRRKEDKRRVRSGGGETGKGKEAMEMRKRGWGVRKQEGGTGEKEGGGDRRAGEELGRKRLQRRQGKKWGRGRAGRREGEGESRRGG